MILLAEAEQHPFASALPTGRKLRSLAGVPLLTENARVGTLMVASLGNRTLTARDQRLLGSVAQHGAVALENARLYGAAQAALGIQAMLTQEMNHRVKNNLQTIADILTLQLRRQDQTTDEALANSVSRIKAMAVVHDLLTYQSETSISLYTVASELAKSITRHATDKQIKFAVLGQDLSLPLKQATSLSLSLNELITNAVKHGFVGRDVGEIEIIISLSENQARLTVHDDGVGLPDDFDPSRNGRLGLKIVDGLVTRELGGEFRVDSHQGTTATITIPRSECDQLAPIAP